MNNTALSAEKTKKKNIIFISDAHEKFCYESCMPSWEEKIDV